MRCIVEGCPEESTTSVLIPPLSGKSVEEFGPWEAPACDFHAQALQAGEAFSETENGELRIGTRGVPPRLLGYTIKETGLVLPELTLQLGHDGIVDQEVVIQISADLHKHLFINDRSELAKEVERNKPES